MPARAAVLAAHVSHHFGGGFPILLILVLAALGFSIVRLRNRRTRVRDEEWRVSPDRREPTPGAPRSAASDSDGIGDGPVERHAAAAHSTIVAPERPVAAPERPVTAPERPVAAPERPVTAPERPVAAPERPVTAPERPIAGEARAPRAVYPAAPLGDAANGWAVETHGLTKRFGSNTAVDDVELLVPRGSAFGYLGPNGAGKTTLMRTLLGLTRANAGTMALLGTPVPAERSRALARVGAIVDEARFHPHLTGRENLRLLAAARGGEAGQRIAPSLARVGLTDRADDKVASYSMGMRQRLGVAACLLGDPELLILDEPMNGLDPAGMHEMRTMIQALVDEGRTVMLSSHLLDEVERTCDAVAIVDHGRVIRQGPIDELVRGAGTAVVRVDCSDPAPAARVIEQAGIAAGTAIAEAGLNVTLPAGAPRETVAEINRRLVASGISVYGLQEVRTSLEDWFLSVTSRLGEPS
jgi:ABC-2 type transport system ATP-binding protein